MISITDNSHVPTLDELSTFTKNPLFDTMCSTLLDDLKAKYTPMYSRETAFLGWNLRFYKAGRTLCRLYPRPGFFIVLVVVGPKERNEVEATLPLMSPAMRACYESTGEGMGQRWLMPQLHEEDDLYRDVLELVRIRRRSK